MMNLSTYLHLLLKLNNPEEKRERYEILLDEIIGEYCDRKNK